MDGYGILKWIENTLLELGKMDVLDFTTVIAAAFAKLFHLEAPQESNLFSHAEQAKNVI